MFEIGSRVRISERICQIEDADYPYGVVKVIGGYNIFVDFGVIVASKSDGFVRTHNGNGLILTETGRWFDPNQLLPAYEEYDPSQEPEDDCL